ncbi:MAG: fibronectin type III domain-containing protein [Clostridia bacterium]|nr:fibronectin type III domain-containing protein [Clostridia bacterium]
MKKLWVNLLAVLLFAALAMTCASAEADEEIILGDGSEVEVQVEAADDGIILEDDLSMDVVELPMTEEDDGISLDLSPESLEPATVPADNAVVSNDGAEDFEIINGILVEYKGAGGDVVIPDGVTTIGASAFYDCENLTTVVIPNTVTYIGSFSFSNCSNLLSITIPDGVTSIDEDAFSYCSSLTTVTIPNSVTIIGTSIFSDCTSLTNVTLSNGITSINGSMFSNCSSLATIAIPDSIVDIQPYAFNGCTSLINVTIPNNVTYIGWSVFSGCSSLTSVNIGKGIDSILFDTFNGCMSLESIVLPSNISLIDRSSFESCYNLMNVTLLNGIVAIDNNAFSGCPTTMTFHTPCESKATKWAEGKGYTVVKSDHTPVTDPAVAPTCGKSGLTEGTHCSVCSAVIKAQEEVPALAHTPVKDPAVAPTCTKTGLTEGSHCSVCGKILVKQRTVAKVEHTYVIDDAVAPTCTKAGKTAGAHCSVCGKVFVKQKSIPKLISLKKCTITGIKPAIYTGKAIKPTPVVKYNGKKLVKGVDYTVKYTANKAVGAATVTVTGIGKYGESVSKTFKINPKAVALAGLTAGKQQLTVTWKKGVVNTWYEIQYSLKKNFAGAKTIAIKKAATVKTVLKNLTTGKTYYVRIRAYKTVNGKKYFSAWSKAKSAKVK